MAEKLVRKAAFFTLGCRVNQYETRAIEESFIKEGFEISSFDEKCDVYVINTCTVTAESDRKSRQMIRRARKLGGKDAVVIACGCMVQALPENAKPSDGFDYACGTRNKMSAVKKAVELLAEKEKNAAETDIVDFNLYTGIEKMDISGSDTTRAFLKISDGCNNNCSYCIIPKARGPVCSKKPEDVCSEIRTLCDSGWREIVLTGIETAAYGKDMDEFGLADLVKTVNTLDVPICRIRLGSMEPAFMKENIIKSFSECEKLMPHYHLSLQSGSDAVLAAMRRKYNTRQFLEVLENLREYIPDVTVTTDIIVGFPGETEEMFEETCEFVRKCGFLYVHIFPYSDRNGTDASKMKQKVSGDEKKRRAAVLKNVMLETRAKILEKYKGSVRNVLVETVENGVASGHTDNFIEVHVKFDEKYTCIQNNDVVPVILGDASEDFEFVNARIQGDNND